jgi:DNA polymerase-3 subunit delta
MTEIHFNDLAKKIKSTKIEDFPQVFLIHGEEFLYKSAMDMIVDLLLPGSSRTLNLDPLEGITENISRAVERINTYSLIPGTKIVALRDAKIFYSREDKWTLFQKAKDETENNEMKKGAGYFTSFLSSLDLDFDDIEGENRADRLGIDPNEDLRWMDKILGYCRDKGISVPKQSSDLIGFLISALEKGFPKGHYLIITTELAGKNHRLYKAIKKAGWIIDSTVPKGERKADKVQQEKILNERTRGILSKRGKSIEKDAYYAMVDMIGFDIRAFANDLEKLINYVGNRDTITLSDVQALLKRTRQDPVFELTNAITDRNIESSLFFLNSMLAAGIHPLQVLTAIANQIRKLIIAKAFTESPSGKVWQKGAHYNYFQKYVVPAILDHDNLLRKHLEQWEDFFNKPKTKSRKKISKNKIAESSDLFLMKNPKNLYPTYQLLKKSDNFSAASLKAGLNALGEADLLMKSTAQNPTRVLENVLFKICGMS